MTARPCPASGPSALRLALFCGVAIGALHAAPVFAQEAPAADAGEIVVTAQRREQQLTDVGLALSVVGAEALANNRVEQIRDLQGVVANFAVKENVPGATPVVTIRGVGLEDFSVTHNPSAGVYIDDVYISSIALMSFDFYDLARVEVLKGPQGTLFGRNTTAGAISFVSARPHFNGQDGYVQAGYGNFGAADLEGAINLPLSDNFALRIAGKVINQDEGYWTSRLRPGDTIGQRELYMGRVQALWEPTEAIRLNLKVEGLTSDSELGQPEFFGGYRLGQPGVLCAPVLAGVRDNTQCFDGFGYTDTDGDPFLGDWPREYIYTTDILSTVLNTQIDVGGGVTFTSVTGYMDGDRVFDIDVDATPSLQSDYLEGAHVQQLSQEFRFNGGNELFNWTLGAFASHDKVKLNTPGMLDDRRFTRVVNRGLQETDSAAAFAHLEWSLSDNLELITGARFTSESKTYVGGTYDLDPFGTSFFSAPSLPSPRWLGFIDDEISDENWSWKVGLNYHPTDDSILYASVSRGVKSGGYFGGTVFSDAALLPYEPEELTSYEVGGRARLFDQLFVDAAVFYYDYSDIQTYLRVVDMGLPTQRLANLDEATLYGLDLDLTWTPIEGLTIRESLGLVHSELGPFVTNARSYPAGNKIANTPETTSNTSVRYEFPIAQGLNMALQGSAMFASESYKEAGNNPILLTDSHWTYDARASLFDDSERWEVALWVKNLSDEQYIVQGNDITVAGYGNLTYNAPRTYGISLRHRF